MNLATPSDAVIVPSLEWLLRTSLSAGAVVLLILFVQFLFGRWLTPAWRCRLWGLVVLRLLLPVVPPSGTSVWNIERWMLTVGAMVPAAGERPQSSLSAASKSDGFAGDSMASVGMVVRYGSIPPLAQASERPVPRAIDVHEGRNSVLPVLAMAIWFAVAAFLLVRLLVASKRLSHRLRNAVPVTDAHALAQLDRCCHEARISRRPMLYVTDAVCVPAAAGLRRPAILLPTGLLDRLSSEDRRAILLHELAHIECRDIALNWLMAVLQAVHWFNPLLWLAFARLRADRESARDAMALWRLSGGRPESDADSYGRTLLKIAELLTPSRGRTGIVAGLTGLFGPAALLLPGLFGRRSSLQRRLQMITRYPQIARRRSWLGPALSILLAAAALTRAKDPPTAPATTLAAATQPSRPERGPQADLQQTLDMHLSQVDFKGTPLIDVIDFLRDVSGANLFVNWKSLEAAGIDRNTPVTARLRNIKFSKALSIILDSVGGGRQKLGYRAADGVINISSTDDLLKNVEVRVYDVRDLLLDIPSYDDVPKLGKQPAVASTTRPATRESREAHDEAAKRLSQTIENTVAPDTWIDRHGKVGALRELEGQLIVTQTPENQTEIARLLDQLRETRSLQCGVDARFVSCDEPLARTLRAKLQKIAVPATLPAEPGSKEPQGAGIVAFFLDDAQVVELLRFASKDLGGSIIAAPKMRLFNGQRAFVLAGTSRAYISAYTATKMPYGRTRYEPITSVVQSGTLLDVRATVSSDRTTATLFLHPQLAALLGMKQVPWPERPAGSTLMVQEPQVRTTEMSTTIDVPVGRTLVLAGLADPNVPGGSGPETRPNQPTQNLFLLVKPKLIPGKAVPTTSAPLKASPQ